MEEVAWMRNWESADMFREALLAWRGRSNACWTHRAPRGKQPAEYRAEKFVLTIEGRRLGREQLPSRNQPERFSLEALSW